MELHWDEVAGVFDEAPDHGLRDPAVRAAWTALLLPLLPPPPALVADLGCGTGSLTVLLGRAGHRVQGVDLSLRMLSIAASKSAGVEAGFAQGDAASPPLLADSFDAVLCRHVLWALPDPDAALQRWISLLRPQGTLLLVEGRWSTGTGITAGECQAMVRRHRRESVLVRLDDPALWGGPVGDERYALVSRR